MRDFEIEKKMQRKKTRISEYIRCNHKGDLRKAADRCGRFGRGNVVWKRGFYVQA